MKKPLQYRIYYFDQEITILTKSVLEGDYIVVDKDTYKKVSDSPSAYKIIDNKLTEKHIENTNGKKRKKFIVQEDNTFPGWIIKKYELYEPIEYAISKPEWFNSKKHSVVGKEHD